MYKVLLILVTAFFVSVLHAAEPDIAAIKRSLTQVFPGVQLDALKVRPSTIPGLLEAEVDTSVFYVSADGKHVVLGDVIDTQTRRNLTDSRRQDLSAKVLASAPEKNMIVIAPAQVRRTITVFTDVDCVYCRRLHLDDVPTLTKQGVRVRYLLFPRQGPGSETYSRAVAVWCASDRVKAVGDAKADKSIAMKTCSNPISENLALAERLGVNGTPAIFLEDGRRLPGYVPAQKMLALLGLKDVSAQSAKP